MFPMLQKYEYDKDLIWAAERHYNFLKEVLSEFRGLPGETYIRKILETFKVTGSPIFVNLDHNIAGKPLDEAKRVFHELETIVRSTAGYVFGYKMNFQSLLTCLIYGDTDFVERFKEIYSSECKRKFGIKLTPVIWLDQKLGDIPNTNFQAADILFKMGFDAIHVLPLIGPDSVAAVQLAAMSNANRGVIHVINMTHLGYKYVKDVYLKGDETIQKLRKNCLGELRTDIRIKDRVQKVQIKATGSIEPANRPFEIYKGYTECYKKKCLVISVGVGPQGALPGCALYAGASCEGIGRFIFKSRTEIETPQKMAKKAELSRYCALLALASRYSGKPYPLKEILQVLKEFNPQISEEIKLDLQKIYEKIRETGLF